MKDILLKDIEEETHNKFKLYCVKNQITMKDALIGFMESKGK